MQILASLNGFYKRSTSLNGRWVPRHCDSLPRPPPASRIVARPDEICPHVYFGVSTRAIEMRATGGGVAKEDGHATFKTPLVLLWAFLTLWWSIFTPPHRTWAARLLLFQPLWCVRMWIQDATWIQDLVLVLSVHAIYSYWTGAWRLFTLDDFKGLDLNDHALRLYIQIFSLLGGCGALAGGIVHRGHQLREPERQDYRRDQRIDEGLLPPLLIPSRTTHSRFFPKKHAFSYSYLFVGIPVGIRGRICDALSVDTQDQAWFNVCSADYLARGNAHLDLAEKLKRYLHTQSVTDRDYTFAYLVTAPRFLGYSFNPVSFWYLYDSDATLKYMILEVNNTFDERRIYLLKADISKLDSSINGSIQNNKDWKNTMLFTDTWDKDFHVSPFNSLKGSYSLRAADPLASYQETGQVQIDNTIVLRSSKESAKMVARVWSEDKPRDATRITPMQLLRFIASWWWVGLATFPRIVWQAQKLYFRKNMHVWYRPEVSDASIGRAYTNYERHLEGFFHSFLKHAVENADVPFRVIYESAQAEQEVVLYSPGFTYEEDHQRTLTLQILSPAFYSRFVHYAHAKEAFDRECLATDEKNRTVVIKRPDLLPVLLDAMDKVGDQKTNRKQTVTNQLRWSLLQRLRCPPPEASYQSNHSSDPQYNITDIRSFRNSELDAYVTRHSKDASLYCKIVTKLFVAQRFAFGVPALISSVDWMLRALFILMTVYICGRTTAGDVLRLNEWGSRDIGTAAAVLMLASSVHFWSLAKG